MVITIIILALGGLLLFPFFAAFRIADGPAAVGGCGWSDRFQKHPRISMALVLVLTLYGLYRADVHQSNLSYVPDGMGVSEILYDIEESAGIGLPGDYEIGIIAYALPSQAANEIQAEGIRYFSHLPRRVGGYGYSLHGLYTDWKPTPAPADIWLARPGESRVQSFLSGTRTAYYYGRGLEIDPTYEAEILEAVSQPGNYFAYGRSGIIVVAPKIQRVIYAHAKY
jgi:hypothetical protein